MVDRFALEKCERCDEPSTMLWIEKGFKPIPLCDDCAKPLLRVIHV